jgi:hypothetical protein
LKQNRQIPDTQPWQLTIILKQVVENSGFSFAQGECTAANTSYSYIVNEWYDCECFEDE